MSINFLIFSFFSLVLFDNCNFLSKGFFFFDEVLEFIFFKYM